MRRVTCLALLLWIVPEPARPQSAPADDLQAKVEARLAEAGAGVRFGLVVADEVGREIVAIAPDARFIPASNTKLFTTAAALFSWPELDRPDDAGATIVALSGQRPRPDVVLTGRGDARLSSAPDCQTNCLAALADTIAARTRQVADVVGDASWFPDERWSAGMSWNNIPERSGTAVAALNLDSNEIPLAISPTRPGSPPAYSVGSAYLAIDNRAVTGAAGSGSTIDIERLPFERTVRITGSIAADGPTAVIRMSIDDPAHHAAWSLEQMLRARGVKVHGMARSHYGWQAAPLAAAPGQPADTLARALPPPLVDDLRTINKASQNLHSELLVRRLGRLEGSGSVRDGVLRIAAMLEAAGVPRAAYNFSDGSGMSTYNRVAPRGVVRFLRWAKTQPWGSAWRATLPVGGVDGTLARRFKGTPLEGRIFAKTGTLNATNALSGYMIAASGKELTFSFLANDVPDNVRAVPTMDAVLQLIAQAN